MSSSLPSHCFRQLAPITTTSLAALIAACQTEPTAPAAQQSPPVSADVSTGSSWTLTPAASPSPSGNELRGVAAMTTTSAWAVGWRESGTGTYSVIERWNGTAWSTVASPNPGAATQCGFGNQLNGVAPISVSDVWAVGMYWSCTLFRPFTAHWNGQAWSNIAVTNPNPNGYTQLNAVTVQGGTQVWAVGTTEASNGATIPLILKWNGTSWTRVTGAIPSGSTNTSLWAVSALPSGELWAVGSWYDYAARRQRPLTEHYVGGSWRVVSTPTPGNYLANMLTGVAALASNNVWAVGFYDANGGTRETLAMHWDGAQWKVVASPNVSHTYGSRHELHGIVALGPSDIWAVGDYFSDATNSNKQTLTLHWNGTAWSIVASPNRGKASSLNAVAASGGVVSAVGLYSIYGSNRYTGQFQVPQNLAMRHF